MPPVALPAETLLPLLIADGDVHFIPAHLWVLDAALLVLARCTPETSAVGRALARMPQAQDEVPELRRQNRPMLSLWPTPLDVPAAPLRMTAGASSPWGGGNAEWPS